MLAKKTKTVPKASTKKFVAKKREKKDPKPKHPLMLDGQRWNKQAVMDIVCAAIGTSSRSVTTILAAGHEGNTLPDYATFARWLSDDDAGNLCDQYARAKEQQTEYLAEEMLDIADDGRNDFMERVNSEGETYVVADQENISRSKLRIEARKWLMGKLKPKKYGEKLDLNLSGEVKLTDEQLDARIALLLGKAGTAKSS